MKFILHRKVQVKESPQEAPQPKPADPKARRCPVCRLPVDTSLFTTRGEWAEYKISGLCRDCQEGLYGPAFNETSSPRGPEK
jgi:hypothetical protein